MNFEEILDQAIAMLQRRGRVTYRTLKWQFQLDDDALVDSAALAGQLDPEELREVVRAYHKIPAPR
jgi:hypothetical protein